VSSCLRGRRLGTSCDIAESPRYASITCGALATSAGVPSAMTAPLASTVTRSHRDITRLMLCSMITTVTLVRSRKKPKVLEAFADRRY
jgi:hypothetical protein